MSRFVKDIVPLGFLVLAFFVVAAPFGVEIQAEENAGAVKRVGDDIRYLASDELEGRGPATPGLQKAADFIRDRFKQVGVASATKDGTYYRPFDIPIDTKVVKEKTSLVLRGPEGKELTLEIGKQYQPMAVGGKGDVKAELVFAGYGVSAPMFKYDDYEDADVEGKVVLIIRREPQQGDAKSVFDGKRVTPHSYIQTKIAVAKKSKAAAIIMVNDPFTTGSKKADPLTAPSGFGTRGLGLPFAHATQAVADQILAASPLQSGDDTLTTLASISDKIDETLTPLTQPLKGWSAELKFAFETVDAEVSNVMGVIEGDGPHADETIVIGAHYDHLGYGPFGSRKPNVRAIHNGADDNATGTAAVMELARRFAQADAKPARRLVFIAFTAEERGLVGSNRYLQNPIFPLDKTVAMLNFDMIGNLNKQGLQLGGSKTGKQFQTLVDRIIKDGDFQVKVTDSIGGSDHAGFYRKNVPVLFCFTGLTNLYHTPEDDFETIDVPGVVKAIDFAEKLVKGVADMPERPEFVKVQPNRRGRGAMAFLGAVPDYGNNEGKGLPITQITAKSPADKAGMKKGDVIIKVGDVKVGNFRDLVTGLRKYRAGQKVKFVVKRGDEEKTLDVTLGRPMRSP